MQSKPIGVPHEVLGFTFYIVWDSEGMKGIDQHFAVWYDKSAPIPSDERIINEVLDTYNQILELHKN